MMYNVINPNRGNSLFRAFDALERELFTPVTSSGSFRTDIVDAGDHYLIQAELPGYTKEEIQLDLTDGILTVAAEHTEEAETQAAPNYIRQERKFGSVSRSFNVSGIREQEITASFENGVLELKLPKLAPELPETRRIEIQ